MSTALTRGRAGQGLGLTLNAPVRVVSGASVMLPWLRDSSLLLAVPLSVLSHADHCQLHIFGINGTGSCLASEELRASSANLEGPAGDHLSEVLRGVFIYIPHKHLMASALGQVLGVPQGMARAWSPSSFCLMGETDK